VPSPALEPAAPAAVAEHHRSARHLVPHIRRSRHHYETFEETEARRNEESAKAASGIHL
jgi:hypothetical protein